MQIESLTPAEVPGKLRELSPDARAVVLLDAAGSLVAATEDEAEVLATLVRELVDEADTAAPGVAQLEVQVDRGAVFFSRDSRHVLAAVTRKAALASLMLYDQRALLAAVEA